MRKREAGKQPERLLWLVYALLGVAIVNTAFIIWGNVPRMSAWLLALLAVGAGQALLLPAAAGAFGGLLVAAAWVVLRQAAGTWQQAELAQSLLELAGVGASVGLAVWLRQTWVEERRRLQSLEALQELVGQHEGLAGLVSREVAEVRLAIEMERAKASGAPVGVILFEATPRPDSALSEAEVREAFRAIARRLGSEVEAWDTPFDDGMSRTGAILPERGAEEFRRRGAGIAEALAGAAFQDERGEVQLVRQAVRIDCGMSLYRGEAVQTRDLMEAAEACLRLSRGRPEEGPWCVVPIVPGPEAAPNCVGEP